MKLLSTILISYLLFFNGYICANEDGSETYLLLSQQLNDKETSNVIHIELLDYIGPDTDQSGMTNFFSFILRISLVDGSFYDHYYNFAYYRGKFLSYTPLEWWFPPQTTVRSHLNECIQIGDEVVVLQEESTEQPGISEFKFMFPRSGIVESFTGNQRNGSLLEKK